MIVELIMYALVMSFIAIVVLGHVLLATAIVQCARADFTGGRRRATNERKLAARPRGSLLAQCAPTGSSTARPTAVSSP